MKINELNAAAGQLLLQKKKTLAVAESCTGGFLANVITDIPSSAYFSGGIVAYSNSLKTNILGVNEDDLAKYGAVSKEVALQMAKGAALNLFADFGISTTGVAGPGGGTKSKPVGTVWVGFWSKENHFAVKLNLSGDRLRNKEQTSVVALDILRRLLSGIVQLPYDLKPQYP